MPAPATAVRLPSRYGCHAARRVSYFAAAVIAVVSCGAPGVDGGASPLRIPDRVACPRCEITARTDLTLTVPADLPDGYPLAVRQDARGRYWVFREAELPALFDAEGGFLQVVGRRGEGPGEYVWPYSMLLVVPDTLVVFDTRLRRVTVLDADLNPVRSLILPQAVTPGAVVAWPETVLVSGPIPPGDSGGPLHWASFAGAEVRLLASFRPDDGPLPPEMTLLTHHHFTQPGDGRFWTAWPRTYDLRQWTSGGARLRTLERRPTWFPGGASRLSYDWRNEPPPAHLRALDEDPDGLLWVFLSVARHTWREAWAHAPPDAPEARAILELLYTTRIEVVDPDQARVVATRALDTYVISALPGRRLAGYEVDENGEGRVAIISLSLVGH